MPNKKAQKSKTKGKFRTWPTFQKRKGRPVWPKGRAIEKEIKSRGIRPCFLSDIDFSPNSLYESPSWFSQIAKGTLCDMVFTCISVYGLCIFGTTSVLCTM